MFTPTIYKTESGKTETSFSYKIFGQSEKKSEKVIWDTVERAEIDIEANRYYVLSQSLIYYYQAQEIKTLDPLYNFTEDKVKAFEKIKKAIEWLKPLSKIEEMAVNGKIDSLKKTVRDSCTVIQRIEKELMCILESKKIKTYQSTLLELSNLVSIAR